MQFAHLGAEPRIHPDAVVAPSAVISGDVVIGPDCQILHGAVITAEGGALTLGSHVIVMENALIRSTATNPVHIGDHVLIGPLASVSGATIEDEVFLATGTRVFNGAHIGARSDVRIGAIVHLRTTLPPETVVPIGWVAVGAPMRILPAERHEEIEAAQRELDFPGYVFGLDRQTPDLMVQLTERYGRSLARHADDRPLG
ncbi:MAG: transferase [Microbacterium sp. SCN 70-18]|uniref:Gamma carbonic anhydrase family protein n=1 Tax=Microbacterium aurantiacum TaxID=162393 RepID=A0AAJ2HM70_9MICO|nr:gamma carbonic anhydrase family protein [Microbacterium aurantiacum]MBN9202442.1 gamma carbonic anhydrase family protein [Microbacterium chocolatum]MDS0246606.1 gamma carbonic anhydrase family protein [Microbacterium aurantiacum]ODT10117.1 MAG: transferase [Microbacterium sp. SCN 70-18]